MQIKILRFLFTILFMFLGLCLYYLQVINGALYKELSYKNSIRLLSINAPRGAIYDRRNKVLADNALSFSVFIVPQEAGDIETELRKLAEILSVSENLLKRNYEHNYYAPFAPCEVIKNISKREAVLIEEQRLDMPGVLVKETALRRYPYKDAMAHVLGYIGEIDSRELETLKSYGYSIKDRIGKDGIEKVADNSLRGRNGGMQIQVDNRGRQVNVLSLKEPEKGGDVHLTIDAELQLFLWKMMREKKGAAIFMDPENGEILSLVSSPSYDPNEPLTMALNDRDKPLLNRAIMGQYPPGSIFKILVALAGLESGKTDPETTYTCHGRFDIGKGTFNCWNRDGHGRMDLRHAIIQSCNIYFYNFGISVGIERLHEYAYKFGFGRYTGIELFGETQGLLPSRPWKRLEKKENWYAGDTANLSIGQGYLLATPLQVLCLIAVVANGGNLVKPHLLKADRADFARGPDVRPIVKKQNLDVIRKAMRAVVEGESGTGARAWSDIVSISAKTGTTQAGAGLKTHAWFSGFAPSEDPEISFVIFLEHGGSGGDVAALMARKAVEFWYKQSQH